MLPRRNVQQGDVVIICSDNLPRDMWLISCVEETFHDPNGYVRNVKLAVKDATLDCDGGRNKDISHLE